MRIPGDGLIPDHNLTPPDDDYNPYDIEQPETCYLCGELIDIGGQIYFGGECFCSECFNGDMSEEEILQTIKKYKK